MKTQIEEAAEAVAKQHVLLEAMGSGNVAHLKTEERIAARARYELECAKLEVLRERLRGTIRTHGAGMDDAARMYRAQFLSERPGKGKSLIGG